MSEETNPTSPQPPAATPTRPPSILSNPKDAAPRPGFRAPANARSKAQKKGKK